MKKSKKFLDTKAGGELNAKDFTEDDGLSDTSADSSDGEEEVDLMEVPFDEIMNNPGKYVETTNEERSTSRCPVCGEYTIFIDGICSECGASKSNRKSSADEDEVSLSVNDIYPDDDLGLDFKLDHGDGDDENYDV